MSKAWLRAIAVLIAAAVAWWLWPGPPSSDTAKTSSTQVVRPAAQTALPTAVVAHETPPAASPALVPEIPRSLADTAIDGGVELDERGQLRPGLALRRLFDQVLSSVGELSLEEIRVLLSARLDLLTTPDGKRQAMAAFERYLRYLQTVDQAAARLSALPLRERLDALVDLRRQQLGSEMADAFFADEEAYQDFTLDRRELADNPDLSADERAARERELIAQLPESAREPFLAQLRTEADLADSAAIDTLASDADERHRLRSERFGEEAAARMELLDRERAAWQQRVAAYQAERARLQALAPGARESALDAYRTQNFSEAERRRIRSLEDIGEL